MEIRRVIAGRVFLSQRDAESYAKKAMGDIRWAVEESPGGHYLVIVKDYGDVDGTRKMCENNGIKAFVWRMPQEDR